MSESVSSVTTSQAELSSSAGWTLSRRTKAKVLLASLLAMPAAGALVGIEIGIHQEQGANAADLRKADADSRCLIFSNDMYKRGKITLRASEIPSSVQKDCRLPDSISVGTDIKTIIDNANSQAPFGSKLESTPYDPRVDLPNPIFVTRDILHARSAARGVGITPAGVYGLIGFIGGVFVDATATRLSTLYDNSEGIRADLSAVARRLFTHATA